MKKTNRLKGKITGRLSVNLGKPVTTFALQQAAQHFDDNVSMYVRSLIKRDMVLNGKA